MLGAVIDHCLHRLYCAGLLHHLLMLAPVVKFYREAGGLNLLPDIVAGIQDAARAVVLIAPSHSVILLFGHQLRLGGAKGDHRHPLRQSDLDSSG